MATLQKVKLSLTDFNPKKVIGQAPEGWTKLLAGTLMGEANDIVERSSPDGVQKFTGLAGVFEVVPADPNADVISSGVCFLPDGFMKPILAVLKPADPNAKAPLGVRFATEVYLLAAKNPQGYTWALEPVRGGGEVAPADPLESLRKAIADHRAKGEQKAIPHAKGRAA